jgi:hypothetical protein
MKSIILAAVLFAGGLWAADEVADRAAIENTIRLFNLSPSRAGLFTDDFDRSELAGFPTAPAAGTGSIPVTVDGVPGEVVISKEPMGEAIWLPKTGLHGLSVLKIRFLTPEVAMADAAGNGPVLILLKKVGTDWKIASLRRLAEK